MRGTIVEDLVVDLVGKDDQAVLAGDLEDLLQQVIRIQRAGGVVGVDDDDGARALGDLGADVVQIRQPARAFITHVVHGRATREADRRRPQRVIRRGHQHLVARVQQRVERQHDQLAHAVADIDVIDRDAADALELRVVHDGLARREKALGIRIAGGIGQVGHDVLAHLVGCIEAERRHVANIQLDDALAVLLHLPGPGQHRSADVVADVGQLGRLVDGLHDDCGHRERCGTMGMTA